MACIAVALLLGGHAEGPRNCGAGFFQVVGIDHQRFRQLARGAGELAQNQHAPLVIARSRKFLGHQVHSRHANC